MRRTLVFVMLSMGAWSGTVFAFVHAFAQSAKSQEVLHTGIVLTKLSPPVYPPLARQARISGEVQVEVLIRQDGSVESAELSSGHPMLAEAALESARNSTFECRACEAVASTILTFTFELRDDGDCCTAYSRPADITVLQAHITIAAPAQCICDPTSVITRIKWRSPKCVYLWHCASRVIESQ